MYGECFSSVHNYELLYAQSSIEDQRSLSRNSSMQKSIVPRVLEKCGKNMGDSN